MDSHDDKPLLRNNPFFVIGIASLIAIAMFTISFVSYYNSDTRKTIEQIQVNNLNPAINDATSTVPKDLNSTYLDDLENKISEQVSSYSDTTEFNPDELTDSALGL